MIRAYIREDLPGMYLSVSIVNHSEGRARQILRIENPGSPTTVRWEELPDPPVGIVEPTLQLGDSEARALLEALTSHYSGVDDTRALRRDYDAERARVDNLTAALVEVTHRLAEPPREAVTYSTSFPGGLPEETVADALRRAKKDSQR
jgi:hypothetical protein